MTSIRSHNETPIYGFEVFPCITSHLAPKTDCNESPFAGSRRKQLDYAQKSASSKADLLDESSLSFLMRRFIQTVAVLSLIAPALIALGSIDDQILDSAGLDPKLARGFLTQLKQALASGNKQAVSKLIAYPISVSLQGKKRKITSREEFEAHYAEIVTENVAKAVQNQSYEHLSANSKGVMIGSGELWFSATKGQSGKFDQYRVIGINN